MKNLSRLVVVLLTIVTVFAVGYFVMESSAGVAINTAEQKIAYDLPYPGLLSDSPIYFVKIVRDRITEFLTRENISKAKLYLLYSDKRAAMSLILAQKGKNSQAVEALSKSEKYFLKIIPLLKEAGKQGASPESGFVETLKLANAKHNELIGELLKVLPGGFAQPLKQIEITNLKIKHDLETL